MKKIAAARTKGEWFPIIGFDSKDGISTLLPTGENNKSATIGDLRFIAMAANKWDNLIAVVEAAKNISNLYLENVQKNSHIAIQEKLLDALKALESE